MFNSLYLSITRCGTTIAKITCFLLSKSVRFILPLQFNIQPQLARIALVLYGLETEMTETLRRTPSTSEVYSESSAVIAMRNRERERLRSGLGIPVVRFAALDQRSHCFKTSHVHHHNCCGTGTIAYWSCSWCAIWPETQQYFLKRKSQQT